MSTVKILGGGGRGARESLDLLPYTYQLIPDTDHATLEKLEVELTEQGFDCWETTIGGPGVIAHSSNLDNYHLPEGFRT